MRQKTRRKRDKKNEKEKLTTISKKLFSKCVGDKTTAPSKGPM